MKVDVFTEVKNRGWERLTLRRKKKRREDNIDPNTSPLTEEPSDNTRAFKMLLTKPTRNSRPRPRIFSSSMLEKAEQAIYPSFAPRGYRNVMGPNGKRIIEPEPDVAPIITQIFQWYATGQCSIVEVTERARQAGLVSRGAKKPISKYNIHKLLRKKDLYG